MRDEYLVFPNAGSKPINLINTGINSWDMLTFDDREFKFEDNISEGEAQDIINTASKVFKRV